ncbi:hypothetical protein FIBSPDRAFT_950096 [Athelia psychrophila]|uniref:Uncharacterized protein n=1 Tax=Athelia psychrophila TaxID=1759441 RepID=A0A166P3J1_9AGAM|nr:hypothetical protein FIBSPDRAFT_950096 [Fibularhizoctonia sp. CBS 109695]
MISVADLITLGDMSKCFLNEHDFGSVEVEDVMQGVFGDYADQCASAEAVEWAQYWNKLIIYDEAVQDSGMNAGSPPLLPGHLSSSDVNEGLDTESETEGESK